MSEQEELILSIIDALGPRQEDDGPLVFYGSPRVRRLVGVYQAFFDERLEALRKLHRPATRTVDGATLQWCVECQQDYPCPTVMLLEAT